MGSSGRGKHGLSATPVVLFLSSAGEMMIRCGKVKYFLVQASQVSDFSTVYHSQEDSLNGMQRSTSIADFNLFVPPRPGTTRGSEKIAG